MCLKCDIPLWKINEMKRFQAFTNDSSSERQCPPSRIVESITRSVFQKIKANPKDEKVYAMVDET